jgi:hypothetical protein
MTRCFIKIVAEIKVEDNWIGRQIEMPIIITQTAKASHRTPINNQLVVLIITRTKIVIQRIK